MNFYKENTTFMRAWYWLLIEHYMCYLNGWRIETINPVATMSQLTMSLFVDFPHTHTGIEFVGDKPF